MVWRPITSTSMRVRRKQSSASSGRSTIGSFSLNEVLSSTGTPVRRAGVRIGEVTGVSLEETEAGRVRVAIGVDRNHPVRKNEVATLVSSILGGDATIDFLPKEPQPGEVVDRSAEPPGAELIGATTASVNALINRASALPPWCRPPSAPWKTFAIR